MAFVRSDIKAYAATFSARGVSALGNMILLATISHTADLAALGQFSLGLSVLMGGAMLARFGADMSILRHGSIAWSNLDEGLFRGLRLQAAALSLAISLGFALTLFLFADVVASVLLDKPEMLPVLTASAIVLPAFPLMFLQSAWLKVAKLPHLSPLAEMGAAAFLGAAVIFALSMSGAEMSPAEFIIILGACVVVILVAGNLVWARRIAEHFGSAHDNRVSAPPPRRYYKDFLRELPDYAVPSVMSYFSNWGIIVILGMFADYEQVGALTIVLRVVLLVNVVSTVVVAVISPRFAPLHAKGDFQALQDTTEQATLLSICAALPAALTMVAFPGVWLGLFGSSFSGAELALPVLAFAQLVNVATGPVGVLLYMTGHQIAMRRIVVTVSTIGFLSSLVIVPKFGLYGAVAALTFIVITQNLSAAVLVKRHLGFHALPKFRKQHSCN